MWYVHVVLYSAPLPFSEYNLVCTLFCGMYVWYYMWYVCVVLYVVCMCGIILCTITFLSTIWCVPCSVVCICCMYVWYYTLRAYLFLSTIRCVHCSGVCICCMYVWYYMWYVCVVLYCSHIPFSEYDPVCTLFSCCLQ